jgi:sulfur-oxidizing protein SoxY
MIRHPNHSGLQMDQVTHLYIPARYIDHLRISEGDELVFSAEGGISISEDPNFRFEYSSNGASRIHAEAVDTEGRTFSQDWPL